MAVCRVSIIVGWWRCRLHRCSISPILSRAYDQPEGVLAAATDDASLVELVGGRVGVVPGNWENLKVTNAFDLQVAELLLAEWGRWAQPGSVVRWGDAARGV